MENLKSRVDSLISQVNSINLKITEKVKSLEIKAQGLKSNIDVLMQDLVRYDLNEDVKAQNKTDEKISKLRLEHNEIMAKIEAYKQASSGKDLIINELPGLFDTLKKQLNDRNTEDLNNHNEVERINQEILLLQNKKKVLMDQMQLSSYRDSVDRREISRLIPYLEPRPVEKNSEENYLRALVNGADSKALEMYLVKPRDTKPNIPYQGIPKMTTREISKQTRPKEVNDLERYHHYNW